MSNDIDLYSNNGGEVQTYAPSQPLAPAPAPDQLTNREIDEYQRYTGGGQMVFGQTLPPGTTLDQMKQTFVQLGGVFVSDFLQLGHDISRSQKAANWLIDAITNPPKPAAKRHSYNLFEHANDPVFQAFANYAHDQRFPAKFVQDACWWVTEASKKLGESQGKPAQGSAPNSDPTDNLTDAQYANVLAINKKAIDRAKDILRQRWGDSYAQNIRVAQQYVDSLPAADHQVFAQFTSGWIQLRYTPEFWLEMFAAATGAHSIPNGAGIAREIAECEKCMRTNRKQWLADNALQARYRTLLDMRDGR